MQLLRDNLTLWTSDMQGEGEDKGEGKSFELSKLRQREKHFTHFDADFTHFVIFC